MRDFNFEECKAGAPVVTRDGRAVRILATDLKALYPIVGAVQNDGHEVCYSYTIDGRAIIDAVSQTDLVMAEVTYYANVYKTESGFVLGRALTDKAQIDQLAENDASNYVKTIEFTV